MPRSIFPCRSGPRRKKAAESCCSVSAEVFALVSSTSFPLVGDWDSCCSREEWRGVGVKVVPRRFEMAVVYFPRQRVHRRFFYSVARAGLCACCVVARGLWFRRVTGRRASFFPCRLWLGYLSFINCPLFLQALPVFWCPSCPPGSWSFSKVF